MAWCWVPARRGSRWLLHWPTRGGRRPSSTRVRRWHLHQRGLYTDEDNGCQHRVAYLTRRATDYGVHTGPVQVQLAEVRRRKRALVESFRNGSQRRLETTKGLELIFGEAAFTGPKRIAVQLKDGGARQLTADKIFINTGCRPARPRVPGLDQVPVLDSSSIMELDNLPEHLLVLGGGYIGLEFGQMFRRFGSAVTTVQRGGHLLSREDPDVADEVAKILRQDGVDVLLNTEAVRVEPGGDGRIRLAVRTPEGERTLSGSHLLAATGRQPNTEALHLDAAGIATDARGFIPVNERLETNAPEVYALGDVNGGPAFTHIAYDDFRIVHEPARRW